jgi:hypothetical protein
MRIRVWDVLAILLLLATVVAIVVFATIFADPTTSLNPFPPPTMPALLVLPTATNTPHVLPPTWTPAATQAVTPTDTLAPSSTPIPSATLFVMPFPTITFTPSVTPTETLTPTDTVSPTP